MFALLVHQVIGNTDRRLYQNLFRTAAHTLFFQLTQDAERDVVIRPQQACAVTMRARLGGCLDHTRAQALSGHLQQAKARDAADLNTSPVGLQLVFQALLNGVVVLALIHIDEVDHDQAGKVAQSQLAGNFFRCL